MVDGLIMVAEDRVEHVDEIAGEDVCGLSDELVTARRRARVRLVGLSVVALASASIMSPSMASKRVRTIAAERLACFSATRFCSSGAKLLVETGKARGEGGDGVLVRRALITSIARSLKGSRVWCRAAGAVLTDRVTPTASTMT